MDKSVFSRTNYDFQIPQELIAQEPAKARDSSRLLILDRKKASIKQGIFRDILNFLEPGDVLVLNNTKVIKARLKAQKTTGAKLEVLLLKEQKPDLWEVLVKPGKRAQINDRLIFPQGNLEAKVIDKTKAGGRVLQFNSPDLKNLLNKIGKVPLPSYIKQETSDLEQYQTVYAKVQGAVAAPTAGLHFTKTLIAELKNKGVKLVYLTLHCSLATFRPIKTSDIRNHRIESEWIELSSQAAEDINSAKAQGKRIIAVGTTGVRALESTALNSKNNQVKPFSGDTRLYILPGYGFKIVDALITNFHTPYSTNLVLISSFCGLELTQKAYLYAQKNNFRFYSFGDAMLVI
jgi:S-adenosylmethionine:tRNA ribosyltransferase-isomerase